MRRIAQTASSLSLNRERNLRTVRVTRKRSTETEWETDIGLSIDVVGLSLFDGVEPETDSDEFPAVKSRKTVHGRCCGKSRNYCD